MEPQISEDLLGNPDSTAEHVAAHLGVSSLLKGEMGADYNPKESPFSYINRLSDKAPYIDAFPEEAPRAAALTELNKLKNKTIGKIESGAKKLFGYDGEITSDDENAREFHELYDHSGKLASSPELLMQHLANQTSPISDHAPNTTMALSGLGSIASEILQQAKPNLTQKAPFDIEPAPSQVQISKFNKVAKLLDNPLSIYSKVEKGTINNSDIALMRQVYPNLLQNIQQETFKNLIQYKTEQKGPLDYNMRLGVSKLLGQNLDSSLLGLGSNQMALNANSQAQAAQDMEQGKAMKASKTGISKMKVTGEQTRYQQATARRS